MKCRLFVLGLFVASTAAFARSGGIEAQNCSGCHGTGSQQTSITLTPPTFNPGDTITVRVTIRGTGANGGLFLTANGTGTFATMSGQNTRLVNGNVVHSSPKTSSSGAVTFDVRWTAPASMGGVDFETATVLANGSGGSGGDQASDARAAQAFGCGAGITYFRDIDGDGVGSMSSGTTRNCAVPSGYSATEGDCDDFDNRKTPNKTESCNSLDDNCNGQVDEGLTSVTTWPDADGDGYGWALGAPASGCGGGGRAQNDMDCDDTNRNINPAALETCNQKDDDCDNQVDEGARVRCGEGWCARLGPTCRPADCVPGPPLTERCNALDDDCDGLVDDGELCGPGASCVMGTCLDGVMPPVDAGVTERIDAGVSVPRGESTGCSSVAAAWWPLVVLLMRRRTR
jgi:hypothetical protein